MYAYKTFNDTYHKPKDPIHYLTRYTEI